MKKILLLLSLFLLLFSLTAHAEGWIHVQKADANMQRDVEWYFSPEHTKINQFGRLETWIKYEYAGQASTPTLSTGDYSIWIVYVDSKFEKQMTTKITEYKQDGTIKNSTDKFGWQPIATGSNFEAALLSAHKYASENK